MNITIGTIIMVVIAIIWAVRIVIGRALRASLPSKMFERYQHHGQKFVWVRADLRGDHRDHCLCFDCKRFHPGSGGNCKIAQAVYENCVKYNIVTPMWECPVFVQDPFADDRKWNQK